VIERVGQHSYFVARSVCSDAMVKFARVDPPRGAGEGVTLSV